MLRFRNPGTQYSTQVQVIKQLYAALGHQESFSLNDIAVVIAQGRLMTAYGYAGDDAIRLSMTDQESMNSALGQFTRNYTQTTKRGLLTTNKG